MSATTTAGVYITKPSSAPSVAAGSQIGSMTTTGNYSYKVTFVTGWGETDPSVASSSIVATNGTVVLASIPVSADSNVISKKIYRTATGGATYALVDTIKNEVTTYTDDLADADRTDAAPTINTAHSLQELKGWVKLSMPSLKVSATIAAAGTNAATAAQLVSNASIHFVSGASGTSGVKLPGVPTGFTDYEVVIKNEHATNALIVHPFGGSDTIDGSASYSLAAATTKVFHLTATGTWKSY
jgi:hypothetical protein